MCDDVRIAEFIGAFIGDGYLCQTGTHYTVGFTGDSRSELQYYEKTIIPAAKLLEPTIRPKLFYRPRNTLQLKFYSKSLYYKMVSFGFTPGPKSRTVQIPPKLLCDELLPSVVRGLFDTDGCVFWDERSRYAKPYPRITFTTTSPYVFEQVQEFLQSRFKIYTQHLKSRDAYTIDIYGHKNLALWLKTIGFSNPRHHAKIPASVATVVEPP